MKSFVSLLAIALAVFSNTVVASGGANWVGSNLYYAAGLKEDTRATLLKALEQAEVKVLRVWLDGQSNGNTKGTDINSYPGLEDNGVGKYDDTVLEYLDDFMVDAKKYGVKLMVSMHSWNALSGGDTYSQKFGKSGFYTSQQAQQAFDQRIQHVLSHKHKTLGKTWAELSDYIFAFEPQNEAMIGLGQDFIKQHASWQCDRASTIKAALKGSNILTTTGGESWVSESVPDALFADSCKDLDIIALHGYNDGDFATSQLQSIASKAQGANKMVIFQEWGVCYFDGDCSKSGGSPMDAGTRQSKIKQYSGQIADAGIPAMYWQVLPNNDPHYGWDYEIGITESNLFNTFVDAAKSASQKTSPWDWSQWLSSSSESK